MCLPEINRRDMWALPTLSQPQHPACQERELTGVKKHKRTKTLSERWSYGKCHLQCPHTTGQRGGRSFWDRYLQEIVFHQQFKDLTSAMSFVSCQLCALCVLLLLSLSAFTCLGSVRSPQAFRQWHYWPQILVLWLCEGSVKETYEEFFLIIHNLG